MRSERPVKRARRGGRCIIAGATMSNGITRLATRCLVAGICLSLAGGTAIAQQTQTSWTITVDCQSGQSINEALAQTSPFLTIEVRGQCVEDVVVRRDGVTLRGIDPQRDGIRSPGGPDSAEATLLIRGARRVTVANLRISGGRREGLRVLDSTDDVTISNCNFESNGVWGASVTDSTVAFVDSEFSGNGALIDTIGGGLIAARGSDVACSNCVSALNPQSGANLGAVAFSGSTLRLLDSRIEGDTAALAQSYARLLIENTELVGVTWAFQANAYGTARLTGGTISGPMLAKSFSSIELIGATQVLNQLQNFVTESSKLIADRLETNQLSTTLGGLTLVADFSTGRLVNGTAVEELMCALGGDIVCDASTLKGPVSGCGSCSP